jgi:two-component system sensor histidine kinase AlgZ
MHPILSDRSRLTSYLAAWIPVTALVAGVLVLSNAAGWAEAVLLAFPLAMVYAFLCLSSWYLCRAMPVRSTPFPRVVATLVVAAASAGALWVAAAATLTSTFSFVPRIEALFDRLGAALIPLLALGALLYLLTAALHYLLLALEDAREHERRAWESQGLAKDAELRALRAQLHPHFLFNALHAVSTLTVHDPAAARETCVRLSDFLRKTLGFSSRERVPLSEELALVRDYLAIEKVRFGDRLQLEEVVDDDALTCSVPPLVENAVLHGIEGLLKGGGVRLEARASGDAVHITVENAFDPEAHTSRHGTGRGLTLVRERLAASFGAAAALKTNVLEGRFRAEITVPAMA